MANIELYSAQVCPFAHRTRLVLLEKGLDFSLTEIDLENKPDWFMEISPYGKVPVLKHGEFLVYESCIINEYLDEAFPQPELMPKDPGGRAMARIWMDFCNQQFIPAFYKLLLAQEENMRADLRDQLLQHLRFIEGEGLMKLSKAGPFWLGETLSLVDIAYYPFFERFVVASQYRGVNIPEECTRIRAWYAAMRRRESVKSTANTPEFYIEKYAKYADGTASGITAREMRGD